MDMKKKAYLLVFDGLADWEPALAMCEINKSKLFDVVTVGFSKEIVTSMGGLKIKPDITLDEVEPENACILILPGGDMWEDCSDKELADLLRRLHGAGVPIAAICGATLAVARAGLLHGVHHTSNTKAYLRTMVPEYQEDEFYVDKLAVSDQKIITASGVGSVEFAYEILKTLQIYGERDQQVWFDLFKHGVIPQETA